MSRQEKSSRQPEARPYFMRAFSAVDSPKLEAFYSSLLSPIGPLAAGAPGRAALESQSPGRDHPYTAQVLPHLYMESTGGTSDILRGPKPGTEQADTRGQHTSYASAALAAVLQRQPHETSQSTLSASPGMVVKSLDRTCDHSDTHSAAPPDLPAHLKPIAAARLQGSAFPPGPLYFCIIQTSFNIINLSWQRGKVIHRSRERRGSGLHPRGWGLQTSEQNTSFARWGLCRVN